VSPNDDKPGFVAEKPEHCFACYRLIRPGQIYHLTIDFEVLCEDCALSEGVIRVREDLAVEVKSDRLLVRRGEAAVEVFPGDIRRLVNALAKAGVAPIYYAINPSPVCRRERLHSHLH
jgi:hypothetical protein